MVFVEWKANSKSGSIIWLAFYVDGSTEFVDNTVNDGQAQTAARVVAAGDSAVRGKKRFEDVRQNIRRDAAAGIAELQYQIIIAAL